MKRRRFIKILASSIAGLGFSSQLTAANSNRMSRVQWKGYTMGAMGQFTIYDHDRTKANAALNKCFKEIVRMEKVFSLYDPHSEISRLNRTGVIENPSTDWIQVLRVTDRVHQQTNGLFDPTVQTLWDHYSGNQKEILSDALNHVGWEPLEYNRRRLRVSRNAMKFTFNGIAQGAITDRITSILKDEGFSHVLVELGETRAIGSHPDQRPWSIGIRHAKSKNTLFEMIDLEDNALASSGGYGSKIDTNGRFQHLINPLSGRCETSWKAVSVVAPTAIEADAYSTGLAFAPRSLIQKIEDDNAGIRVILQT